MKVYALVGKSGTGKSYKALELAYENNIDYIIDDGILINKGKIIAGISAKQAPTIIEAVKRAIFKDSNHRETVRNAILSSNIDKILIIGTSNKMVNQIKDRLGLENIQKLIQIEDISTPSEINVATESRQKGNHIIPVPAVEIKQMTSGISINPLRRFIIKKNKESKVLEKTVIKPTFSYIGKFYINPNVINQIITYEINNMDGVSKINKIEVSNLLGLINLRINISINNVEMIKKCEILQKNIKNAIEGMTLINVDKIDIYINKIK